MKLSLERLRYLRLALPELLLTKLVLLVGGGVRVKAEEDLLVPERVLLEATLALCAGSALGCAQDALDFGAVDQTGKVCLADDVRGQEEVLLER